MLIFLNLHIKGIMFLRLSLCTEKPTNLSKLIFFSENVEGDHY